MTPKSTLIRLAAAVAVAALPAFASAGQKLVAETTQTGSPSYMGTVALAKVVGTDGAYEIEVSADKSGSKSLVALANGQIDLTAQSVAQFDDLAAPRGAFKELANASKLAANVRGIISLPGGIYHIVTYADSGIKTFADLKGKRVFAGPKSATARTTVERMIRAVTGYEAGKDYELVDLDFAGGQQAFLDGHVDVYARPMMVGSANIEQLGTKADIRILSLGRGAEDNAGLRELVTDPGRGFAVIPPGVYPGQVNETDAVSQGFQLQLMVNKDMDEAAAYAITKAIWDNFDAFKATTAAFSGMTRDNAFDYMNAPLHPGAYRYYKEAGFDIPASIVPTE